MVLFGKHTERHDLLEVGEIVVKWASSRKGLPDAWQSSPGEHEGPHETEMRSVSARHPIFARIIKKSRFIWSLVCFGRSQKI
jgi:hypothetical protein